MASTPITDANARTLRSLWFDYLDTIEPLRPALHAYGMRLTGNLWDAEDLVQETLLKGFAMIGRGDLHGAGSPVADTKAYLFRTATNLWIDARRRALREQGVLAEPQPEPALADADAVRAAGERIFAASPQARAAVVLKDVFEFSLDEIADLLGTTPGAIKSALHRGREDLKLAARDTARPGPPRELVDRFVEAFNAHDLKRLIGVMTETMAIEVPGVGGGRGREQIWSEVAVATAGTRAERHRIGGEDVVVVLRETETGPQVYEVIRLAEEDGRVGRLTDYCFAADTMRLVGEALNLPAAPNGYHQSPDAIVHMVATTTLPWASPA